jgi:hypothetical protein
MLTKFIVLLSALCLSTAVLAGQAVLTWTAPTTNTDGSALTDGLGYKIYYGTTSTNLNQNVLVNGIGTLTYTVANLPAGTWYFAATTRATSGESAKTGTVSTTIVPSLPSPPSGLVVVGLVAHVIKQTKDNVSLVAVGTVPNGTACDTSKTVNGMYVVPSAAVTWFGSVRSEVVLAQCG